MNFFFDKRNNLIILALIYLLIEVMKKSLLIPLAAGVIASGHAQLSTQKNLKDTLTTSFSDSQKNILKPDVHYKDISLSSEQKNVVETAIGKYNEFFACGIKEITITTMDEASPNDEDENTTLAYTESNTIFLNPQNIPTDKNRLENIIINQLFHIIKPKEATAILPCILADGYTMIGYHGLSIQVSKENDTTQFGVIEDAAAEACAAKLQPDYKISNVYYANIGSLMLKMIAKQWLTVEDIIHAQQTNDVNFLVGKILNTTANSGDIETIMGIFNDVYTTDQDTTQKYIAVIENMRK